MKFAPLTIPLAVLLAASSLAGRSAAAGGAYYSAAQASAGAKAYQANCSRCHGADLSGTMAPALKGAGFAGSQSVAEIYAFMRSQMPVGAPGNLSPGTYTAILAYLLQQNGHPAGARALTPAAAGGLSAKL